eukprot:4700270-Amphidinium_carterae.1
MKKQADETKDPESVEFSSQYNVLKSVPKGVLYNDIIPRILPELRTELLKRANKLDEKACHKLFYLSTCLSADHPFGPKVRSEFVDLYIRRARTQGNLLHRVVIDDHHRIQWESCGLYWLSLSADQVDERVAEGLVFDTIHVGEFKAPMGHRAVGVDKQWKIVDNWLLHDARLVDENGKRGMNCMEFFEG